MPNEDDRRADAVAETISAASLIATLDRGTTRPESPELVAGRYAILGMLGSGAMGTVYRAHDRELDEIVALKVLKKELASGAMIERFRREVKLARRVTHRNVARTFDIGEHGGDRFLTMEFVDGEMLGAVLARRGRLALADVVALALDVCSGLAAAHAAGVLHRDLKPENVVVAKDGHAVITDFGIARVVSTDELSRTAGGFVGTPAYMSPEQVEGAADLDGRTDLYALGAMMYELLTGTMPWKGDSVVAVAAGRLLRAPPDPREVLPNLLPAAADLVLKLMARRRDDRVASAEEAARLLKELEPSAAGATVPTAPAALRVLVRARAQPGARVVVVLPILNLGASDDLYLVDNVLEDIVDHLSIIRGLLVRPRGETLRFVEPTRDVREIGRTLGADVVVDGSLRRAGDKIRASFRLIAVEDGFQLWARRFDRAPGEVLSIADEAAQAIAGALTTELVPGPARGPVGDSAAEELFLRGRFLMRQGWFGVSQEAADVLGRASERSPNDARIVGTLALAIARVYGNEFHGREVAERAQRTAVRALELDPKQAEAKVALATILLQNSEPEPAVRLLRDALALAPNSLDALDALGRILAEVGRLSDAVVLHERVCAIDPDFSPSRVQLARLKAFLGDPSAMPLARASLPRHLGDVPTWFLAHGRWALWHRDLAASKQLRSTLSALELTSAVRFPVATLLDIIDGDPSRMHDVHFLDRMLPIDGSRPPRRSSFFAQMRAELFAYIGEPDRALAALDVADAFGLFDVTYLEHCPLLRPLRGAPSYARVEAQFTARARSLLAVLDGR